MIFKKIALPDGVTKKEYWKALILGITNDKICSLQSNFKQKLFKQFQGNLYELLTVLSCCRLLTFCLCYVLKNMTKK
jgi:hypothetical protein